MIYIDTNIFIYAADKKSAYFSASKLFLANCIKERIEITTATETFQEIIHYLKNREMIKQALKICNHMLTIIPIPLPVDTAVVKTFLKVAEKYGSLKKADSRDLLHLSFCIEYKIDIIITYDKAFSLFEEVETMTPEQYLKRYL